MLENLKISMLLDTEKTISKDLFLSHTYPWEILTEIKDFVLSLGKKLPEDKFYLHSENVWIAKSAKLYPNVFINGPCIIDEDTEVRPGAFIRGSVIVGKGCVIGNSTELKNCIIFDCVQIPHFNYVGDSVLGYRSHIGAGGVTSNVKSDKSKVVLHISEENIETGLKKLGAIIGDYVEVGCNSVLNPGTVIGRNSNIYPCSSVRGFVPADCIYKDTRGIFKKIQ